MQTNTQETRSIADIIKMTDDNKLVLPEFQRDFKWPGYSGDVDPPTTMHPHSAKAAKYVLQHYPGFLLPSPEVNSIE
jgi:hypothetical protein